MEAYNYSNIIRIGFKKTDEKNLSPPVTALVISGTERGTELEHLEDILLISKHITYCEL